MPGGDRTGPMGMGAMTGRRAGYCSGINLPGFANPVARRGWGIGGGRSGRFRGQAGGRGRRNWFYTAGMPDVVPWGPYAESVPTADGTIGKDILKKQADVLQAQLNAIQKKLDEMEETGSS